MIEPNLFWFITDNRSIEHIRNFERIEKLVYVSCSPKSVFKNFLDLCRPSSRTLHGRPFTPKKAVAVDLFPHTNHMELVVLFERDPIPFLEDVTKIEQDEKMEINPENDSKV